MSLYKIIHFTSYQSYLTKRTKGCLEKTEWRFARIKGGPEPEKIKKSFQSIFREIELKIRVI